MVAAIDSDVLGPVANTATIAADSTDPTPANNTSTTTLEVIGSADLGVSKQGEPNPVAAGRPGHLHGDRQQRRALDGAGRLHHRHLADRASHTWPGRRHPRRGVATEPSGGMLDCDLGDLLDDATASVTFSMSVPSDFTGSDTNTVTVDSTTDDPVADNNTAEALSSAESTADLSVFKADRSGAANRRAGVHLRDRGGQLRPVRRPRRVVIDVLPAGVVAQSAGPCAVDGQVVTCTVGTLPGGSIAFFDLPHRSRRTWRTGPGSPTSPRRLRRLPTATAPTTPRCGPARCRRRRTSV